MGVINLLITLSNVNCELLGVNGEWYPYSRIAPDDSRLNRLTHNSVSITLTNMESSKNISPILPSVKQFYAIEQYRRFLRFEKWSQ